MSFWARIVDAAATLDEGSYYELLGIERSASGQDASSRFYELTRRIHPDRHARERDAARIMALTRVYARLNEAVRVLTDPGKRAAYDRGLAEGRLRLEAEAAPTPGPRETRDPRSVTARAMYERGLALLEKGDLRAARGQLDLALQIEPGSRAIEAALERVRSDGGAARQAPREAASGAKPEAPAKPALTEAPAVPAAGAAARAHTRVSMTRAIRIKLGSWESFREVYSRDISRGGILLESEQPIDPGTTVNLKIDLPGGDALELAAVAVRTVRRAGDGSVGVGLSFCEMSADTERRLRELLASCERELAQAAQAQAAAPGLEQIVPLLARAKSEGPVSLLALPSQPTVDDVQRAYDALCAQHDPSRFATGDARVREAAFELVVLARVAYDQALARIASANAEDSVVAPLPALSVRRATAAPRGRSRRVACRRAPCSTVMRWPTRARSSPSSASSQRGRCSSRLYRHTPGTHACWPPTISPPGCRPRPRARSTARGATSRQRSGTTRSAPRQSPSCAAAPSSAERARPRKPPASHVGFDRRTWHM